MSAARFVASWALASALVMAPTAARADDAAQAGVVEGHLLAPCCYLQTLDAHQSELADTLRAEVRGRIASGESPTHIEDDFAARYGDRVRAVPQGHDRRHYVVVAFAVVLAVGGLLLLRLLRRWRTPLPDEPSSMASGGANSPIDAYDARLDQELADLDD